MIYPFKIDVRHAMKTAAAFFARWNAAAAASPGDTARETAAAAPIYPVLAFAMADSIKNILQ